MICSRCRTDNPPEAAFCRNCGSPLITPQPSAAAPVAVAAAPLPQTAKNPGRWPIAAGLLSLFGFLGYLIGIVSLAVFYTSVYGMPADFVLRIVLTPANVLTLILGLLSAILFLAPTKKVPVLSALPRLLYSLILPVLLLLSFLQNRSLTFGRIVSLALSFVLPVVAILYFVGTLIRSKSAVLPGIHLGLSIFYGLFLLIAAGVDLLTAAGIWSIASAFFTRLSELLPLAGYAVAAFSLRRKG